MNKIIVVITEGLGVPVVATIKSHLFLQSLTYPCGIVTQSLKFAATLLILAANRQKLLLQNIP